MVAPPEPWGPEALFEALPQARPGAPELGAPPAQPKKNHPDQDLASTTDEVFDVGEGPTPPRRSPPVSVLLLRDAANAPAGLPVHFPPPPLDTWIGRAAGAGCGTGEAPLRAGTGQAEQGGTGAAQWSTISGAGSDNDGNAQASDVPRVRLNDADARAERESRLRQHFELEQNLPRRPPQSEHVGDADPCEEHWNIFLVNVQDEALPRFRMGSSENTPVDPALVPVPDLSDDEDLYTPLDPALVPVPNLSHDEDLVPLNRWRAGEMELSLN